MELKPARDPGVRLLHGLLVYQTAEALAGFGRTKRRRIPWDWGGWDSTPGLQDGLVGGGRVEDHLCQDSIMYAWSPPHTSALVKPRQEQRIKARPTLMHSHET